MTAIAETWWRLAAGAAAELAVLAAAAWLAERVLGRRQPSAAEAVWRLVPLRALVPVGVAAPWALRALLPPAAPLEARAGAVAVAGGAVTGAAPAAPWWPQAAALLWAAGLAVVACGLLGQLAAAWRWRRGREAPPGIVALAGRWRGRLGVRRPVRVRVSEGARMPFTTGVARPVVVLPEGLAAWPPERLEGVVAHEMAHVARWDAAWLWLENLALAVAWWHPGMWLARARLGDLRERLADAAVVGAGLAGRSYAASLVAAVRELGGRGAPPVEAVLAERGRRLTMRVREIVRGAAGRPWPAAAGAAAVLLLAAAVLPAAPRESGSARPGVSREPVQYVVGGEVTEPVKVKTPRPAYTEEARRARVQGPVLLRLLIDERGWVGQVEVLRGLPLGLTRAAVDTVRRWRFKPATLHGEPVPVYYNLAVMFTLDEEPEEAAPGPAAPAEGPVRYTFGSGITEPEKVFAPPPEYPETARRQGIQGDVLLEVVIGTDGAVKNVKVLRGLGGGCTEAAVEAVKRWRFRPATSGGRPMEVIYDLTVMFRLQEKGGDGSAGA